MGGGGRGPWLPTFRNRLVYGHFNVSLENFRTFAPGKDKGFEFYRKTFELALLPLYRWHDTFVPLFM